ncbi:SCP domain-containing protein [Caenorhabditis elegans]|uniref:SCP domain-containing protein n=1 Tax=Caenorhabditis elegans TaxID=6239 RepID=O02060_CAEEL|nr:SCP domain-containing protein [Caenorhabditis elegans]CCD61255.1 SCP domain-containing protein [Caenorhabditis elegans]|eukprot:NP_491422.2 Uncharacterized protein CELE_B0041.1 [Caenorhabditis elegans]
MTCQDWKNLWNSMSDGAGLKADQLLKKFHSKGQPFATMSEATKLKLVAEWYYFNPAQTKIAFIKNHCGGERKDIVLLGPWETFKDNHFVYGEPGTKCPSEYPIDDMCVPKRTNGTL